MVKASDTGGVKPMDLGGRLVRERERLLGMTDEERAYRAQYLKDQILSANEPREVPQLYKEQYNVIRRIYRFPLDKFGEAITPLVGKSTAIKLRYVTGKIFLGAFAAFYIAYYFKYHGNDWTKRGGWRVLQSRKAIVPGDEEFPKLSERTKGADYASQGFKENKLNL